MDILLIPSNTKKIRSLGGIGNIAKFTSPLKLFDYLASGKLIIASNVKVFKEILEDKKNCIIVSDLDAKKWIKVIRKAKFKLSKINKIKKNAFELSRKYTYLKRAQKLLNY
jgi:glycosyltransferase involved in cell wall biosynthesis